MQLAQQQYIFLPALTRFIHKPGHQLARDSSLLKFGQDRQREDYYILSIRIVPNQLLQLFIADIVFVCRTAVEDADDLSTHLSNEETLRECIDAEFDGLARRGLLRRKPGSLDGKAFL